MPQRTQPTARSLNDLYTLSNTYDPYDDYADVLTYGKSLYLPEVSAQSIVAPDPLFSTRDSRNAKKAKVKPADISKEFLNPKSKKDLVLKPPKTKTTATEKGKFINDSAKGKLKGFYNKATSPELDWDSTTGLKAYGADIGRYAGIANALYQGYNLARGMQANSEAKSENSDLISDIVSSSYNNPNLQYDISPDQLALLRDLRRGNYDSESDLSDVDLLGALGDAGMGVLTGVLGGAPGMIAGGVGGFLNSIIGDFGDEQNRSNAELEALYQAILASDRQYNDLKRQRAYANFGMY